MNENEHVHEHFAHAIERVEGLVIETELEVGRREETRDQAKRHLFLRSARIALGIIVCIAGVFLVVFPGPGTLVLVAGLAILSRDVPFARKLLVNLRKRLPENDTGEISRPVVIFGLTLSLATISFSLWWWLLR